MSSRNGLITRAIARLKALLPGDWKGQPGERFRKTTQAISDFAEVHHITPNELLDQGVELGRRKLEGVANHEYAAALKSFAETEKINTENELQRRSMETEVSKRAAELKKLQAEARLAELSTLQAEVDLFQKLKGAGIALHRDANGNLTALPAPPDFDLTEIVDNSRLAKSLLPTGIEMRSDGCHVYKNFDGSVVFPDTSITIEPEVTVTGDVHGNAILILPTATVRGNVHGERHIDVRNGARLIGDIRTARIIIEDGAYFKGGIDIIKDGAASQSGRETQPPA